MSSPRSSAVIAILACLSAISTSWAAPDPVSGEPGLVRVAEAAGQGTTLRSQAAQSLNSLIGTVYEGDLPLSDWQDLGGGLLETPIWFHHYRRADGANLVVTNLALARKPGAQQATFRVTDVLLIPSPGSGMELAFFCRPVRANVAQKLIAVVRPDPNHQTEWWRDVRQAWTVALDSGAITSVEPTGIECANEGWGADADADPDPAEAVQSATSTPGDWQAASRPPPVHECDRLAAAPTDPGRVTEGVELENVDPVGATSACQEAVAAYPGVPRFAFQLGRAFAKAGSFSEAVDQFRRAAEQDYPPAMSNLGFMYTKGRGVGKDEGEAVKWYRLAAERGFSLAMTNLGLMYAQGRGVEKDPRKAADFVFAALQSGDALSKQHMLIKSNRWSASFRFALQRRMQQAGYYDGAIDGDFGPATRRAIEALVDDAATTAAVSQTTEPEAADSQTAEPDAAVSQTARPDAADAASDLGLGGLDDFGDLDDGPGDLDDPGRVADPGDLDAFGDLDELETLN